MHGAVLITGAAGFLGTQVTRLVLEQTDLPVIVLIRGRDLSAAISRLEKIWWDWPGLIEAIGSRVQVLTGDVSLSNLGLSDSSYRELVGKTRYIIHLAADIRLDIPLASLRKTNVEGVKNLLDLAYGINRLHGLARFSHVSTAYVAGGRRGVVSEEDLTDKYGFLNNYELSKYEGESLVREAGKELPVSIFRPGMVIGESVNGAIKTFNTVYFPLRLYLTGKLKVFTSRPTMKLNLVPCDYVSEAIARLTFDPKAEGLSFHLTLPEKSLPTVREMLEFTRKWAAEKLHHKLHAPVFLPVRISRLKWLSTFLPLKSPVRSILLLAPYFEENRVYKRANIEGLFGEYQANWTNYFGKILSYAVDHGFLHSTERTVHEQALYRLSSKSRPVRFYDVIDGRPVPRKSDDIGHEINMAVSSLNRMGIRPGDRIAVVGFNAVRYFSIDVAIGLSGAVSVPLYYSSPVRELVEIINSCGARLFFVGVPEILEKLVSANLTIPVVSFCRESPKSALPANFINWKDFLENGEGCEAPIRSSAGFGDIATLRYTSGTTGRPKGAAFSHANLRWMAETLASLPPWKARTRKVTYLSFLPMNHVVEGILTSYSLYYAPAPVDVYFLENFRELEKAMPEIRPTIFFSVSRFYEKVWEKAAGSLIGKLFLGSREGSRKKLLGLVLRLAIKRAAGLGHCAQSIVGSAPVSEGLLSNFRSIGIEIHNAYGLTEAPLITLNRYGANRTDTVGEPLPDTYLRIADDGEVLVKGPQVMKELFGEAGDSPLENGWLHTGDIGFLTGSNHLVLTGRKKEMIINSYGKNINPVKIELMLREATGIDQVMVCGDSKPYCVALLWGCQVHDPAVVAKIESGIQEVNSQLSRPEQVKKWAVMPENLSIQGGSLTANLKMKRSAIVSNYSNEIEALYINPASGT